MSLKGKKDEIAFTLKDTSLLLRIFDATTLTGVEFRQAYEVMNKIEELHRFLTEHSVDVKGKLS